MMMMMLLTLSKSSGSSCTANAAAFQSIFGKRSSSSSGKLRVPVAAVQRLFSTTQEEASSSSSSSTVTNADEAVQPAATTTTATPATTAFSMDDVIGLCKRRGLIFASSEIYNGYAGFYDFGPIGVELKRNVKDYWWQTFVTRRDDVVGLDSSIIHNPATWKSSGTCVRVCLCACAFHTSYCKLIIDEGQMMTIRMMMTMMMMMQPCRDFLFCFTDFVVLSIPSLLFSLSRSLSLFLVPSYCI